jgi:hypothetical protein
VTADPLTFLRDALDARQKQAEAAAEETWRAADTPFGPTVHIGDDGDTWIREGRGVDAAYRCDDPDDTCADARSGYLAEARLIAELGSPAAVLRRIAADRKLIARHRDDGSGKCVECGQGYGCGDWGPDAPCDTIRDLAEGWGWKEYQ